MDKKKPIKENERIMAITEQVNLIFQNRQKKNRKSGLKEHTLKWVIDSMKTIKDISKFYTQEGYSAPQVFWKTEVSFKKPMDSLRCIIAYLYVKLFYYGQRRI